MTLFLYILVYSASTILLWRNAKFLLSFIFSFSCCMGAIFLFFSGHQISDNNLEILLYLNLSFLTGLAIGEIITGIYFKRPYEFLKETQNIDLSIYHFLIYVTLFLSITVSLLIIIKSGGFFEYLATASIYRVNIAKGSEMEALQQIRPSLLHTFTISLFFVVGSLTVILNTNRGHWTILLMLAVIISFNDISRGRLIDYCIFVIFNSLVKKNAFSPRLLAFGIISYSLLTLASFFQGKINSLYEIQFVAINFFEYFGRPLVYIDNFLNTSITPKDKFNDYLNGLLLILEKLSVVKNVERVENRGVSITGWTAVLIYPWQKWLLSDFNIFFSLILSMLSGFTLSFFAFLSIIRKSIYGYALSVLISLSLLVSFISWRYGDVYFILAMITLFFFMLLEKKRFNEK